MLLRKLLSTRPTQFKSKSFYTPKTFFTTDSQALKMAEHGYIGAPLKSILNKLQQFAPLCLASSWDNVGLLVDPMSDKNITNILLTNDVTEDVVIEAAQNKCGLIVSYHPNIFQGLKSVSQKTWKERIVVQCIRNEIAVFSPHTSWDAINGGVNDWLANALPIETSVPILKDMQDPSVGAGRFCTLHKAITVAEAVELIKSYIEIPHLRLALARHGSVESKIETVALCAGSGNSVLNGVKADLYLTGEMLHHDILDATQNDINVILCNHSDSERGFLKKFRGRMESDILQGQAKVTLSAVDRDPLKTV